MDRRRTGDVLWYALQCAKRDRLSLIDAYAHIPRDPAKRDAREDIKAFNRLQQRLFGTNRGSLESKLSRMPTVSVTQLRGMISADEKLAHEERLR